MNQLNCIERAKRGDAQAIAFLLHRSLSPKGITVKANIKGNCLRIMLESSQVLSQPAIVKFVHQGLIKLQPDSIKTVTIYGKYISQAFPAWCQDLDLNLETTTQGFTPTHASDLSNSVLSMSKEKAKAVSDKQPMASANRASVGKASPIRPQSFSIKAMIYGLLVDIIGTYAIHFIMGLGIGIFWGMRGIEPEQIRAIVFESEWFMIVSVVVGMSFTMSGGFCTAHFAKILPLKHAFALGMTSMLLSWTIAGFQVSNRWLAIALLFSIPAALLGGYLHQFKLTKGRS